MMPMRNKSKGEYITGLDLDKYLSYVANKTALKGVPALIVKE